MRLDRLIWIYVQPQSGIYVFFFQLHWRKLEIRKVTRITSRFEAILSVIHDFILLEILDIIFVLIAFPITLEITDIGEIGCIVLRESFIFFLWTG